MSDLILRILLVEDNPDDTLLIERHLRREFGPVETLRVATASALDIALGDGVWDLMLVDYSLPEFSGLAALDLVRRRGLDIPAIVVSGTLTDDDMAAELLKSGASDFLLKDRIARLGSAARTALEAARLRAEARVADLALRASEARYHDLVDSMDGAVIGKTPDGVITSWNPAAERLYGYSAAEAVGRPITMLARTGGAEEMESILAQIRAGAAVRSVETVRMRKDHSIVEVGVTVSPIVDSDGKVIGASSIGRDISDRKRAELDLRENQAHLEAFVSSLDEIVFEFDADGVYRNIWTSDEGLLAAPREMLIGRRVSEVLGEEQGRPFEELFRRVLASGQPETVEYPMDVISGRRWFLARVTPIRGSGGAAETVCMLPRDITDRKTAELYRSEMDAKFRLITENSQELISMVDPEGKYVYVSPSFDSVLGWTSDLLMGMNALEFIHPEDRESVRHWTSLAPMDFRLRKANGVWLWVEGATYPVTQNGKTYVVGTARDASLRRHAESNLRTTNRALKMLNRTNAHLVRAVAERDLLDGVCQIIVDLNGYPLAWVGNRETDSKHSIRKVAWAGRSEPYLDSLHMDWADDEYGRGPEGTAIRTGASTMLKSIDAPDFAPWHELAQANGFGSFLALPLKDSEDVFGLLEICAAEPDGFSTDEIALLEEIAADLAYGILALRDRQARTVGEAAQQFQAHLLDVVNQSVVATTSSGIVTYWNRYAEELFGWTGEEARGQAIGALMVAEELHDTWEETMDRLAVGESWTGEMVLRRKNGTRFPALVTDSPILDEDGRSIGIVGVSIDISDRKRAEEAMLETNQHLKHALADLEAAEAQTIRQERLSALGEMASGIAHDFNNALAPILGYSELLLLRPEEWDNRERMSGYLQLIMTGAQDAASVISRLREFARPHDQEDLSQPIELAPLIEQVIALTQPRWKDQALLSGRSIQVVRQLLPVPPVMGNDAELREALTNLVFNAVDAMPDGGTITLRTVLIDGKVVIQVSDTGMGMTEDARNRCLEPFFSTKGERGTGLGLPMVYGVVKRHGGTLDIQSSPGEGTTVAVRLPLAPSAPAEIQALGHPMRTDSLHVLVVDDEPHMRDVLVQYLQRDGHTVETATNGREGLERFREGRFDLVVTDRAMPEVIGDKLAGAIKAESPTTPVILLTGFGDLMQAAGEIPEGVDRVVAKPVRLATLRTAIDAVVPAAIPRVKSPPAPPVEATDR